MTHPRLSKEDCIQTNVLIFCYFNISILQCLCDMTLMKNILIPLLFCKYTMIYIVQICKTFCTCWLLLHHMGKNGLTRLLKMLPQSLCMELSWFHLLIFYVRGVICKILSLRTVHCRTCYSFHTTSIGSYFE